MASIALAEFEEFVSAHQQRLLRSTYLLTQDRGLAEDLLQEALIKVYRRWRRTGWPQHPSAYLRRAVVNEYLSSRRRRWWSEVPVSPETFPEPPAADDPPVEQRLLVWAALGTLPPRQRTVLVLRLYEGMTDQEIAEQLGCAPGTVRSLASRAYHTLRNHCELFDREPHQKAATS